MPAEAVEGKAGLPLRAVGCVAALVLWNWKIPLLSTGEFKVSPQNPQAAREPGIILSRSVTSPSWCIFSSHPNPVFAVLAPSVGGRKERCLAGLDLTDSVLAIGT